MDVGVRILFNDSSAKFQKSDCPCRSPGCGAGRCPLRTFMGGMWGLIGNKLAMIVIDRYLIMVIE